MFFPPHCGLAGQESLRPNLWPESLHPVCPEDTGSAGWMAEADGWLPVLSPNLI